MGVEKQDSKENPWVPRALHGYYVDCTLPPFPALVQTASKIAVKTANIGSAYLDCAHSLDFYPLRRVAELGKHTGLSSERV